PARRPDDARVDAAQELSRRDRGGAPARRLDRALRLPAHAHTVRRGARDPRAPRGRADAHELPPARSRDARRPDAAAPLPRAPVRGLRAHDPAGPGLRRGLPLRAAWIPRTVGTRCGGTRAAGGAAARAFAYSSGATSQNALITPLPV